MIHIVYYKDDGPLGITTQDVPTTSPWNKLYMFSPEGYRDFMGRLAEMRTNKVGRKNPRIEYVFNKIEFTEVY